ncbi:hypothetical protein [Thalassotalea aquiviva]|uniref:hypothetical protein n=1 Tax=Thalassotalea aquiviva TaxID=3242415 RepID=UPI00352B6841
MAKFYTRIFLMFWDVILLAFTVATIAFPIFIYSVEPFPPDTLITMCLIWLVGGIILGALSLGILMYTKLCELVELKKQEVHGTIQESAEKPISKKALKPSMEHKFQA